MLHPSFAAAMIDFTQVFGDIVAWLGRILFWPAIAVAAAIFWQYLRRRQVLLERWRRECVRAVCAARAEVGSTPEWPLNFDAVDFDHIMPQSRQPHLKVRIHLLYLVALNRVARQLKPIANYFLWVTRQTSRGFIIPPKLHRYSLGSLPFTLDQDGVLDINPDDVQAEWIVTASPEHAMRDYLLRFSVDLDVRRHTFDDEVTASPRGSFYCYANPNILVWMRPIKGTSPVAARVLPLMEPPSTAKRKIQAIDLFVDDAASECLEHLVEACAQQNFGISAWLTYTSHMAVSARTRLSHKPAMRLRRRARRVASKVGCGAIYESKSWLWYSDDDDRPYFISPAFSHREVGQSLRWWYLDDGSGVRGIVGLMDMVHGSLIGTVRFGDADDLYGGTLEMCAIIAAHITYDILRGKYPTSSGPTRMLDPSFPIYALEVHLSRAPATSDAHDMGISSAHE